MFDDVALIRSGCTVVPDEAPAAPSGNSRWRNAKKKPVLSYELFFEDGGEGGLTRCARPAGSLLAGSSFVQLAA
ncbi:hypothetical protein CSM34_003546, partial [Salmonella enterica subsp. arizonae]|nr:hypothetical protein [Salmonella enterica subsp. arizonae]